MRDFTRRMMPLACLLAGGIAGTALANELTGPSSSQSPFVVRSMKGVTTTAILTVGDSVNDKPGQPGVPYRMVGIPDGLGAYDNGDGTFTVLMNHELSATSGVVRAHGAAGAFVSKWTIRKGSLEVLHGEDLIQQTWVWDVVDEEYDAMPTALNRLCAADLPARGAFYDAESGLGYDGRIFMNGEESGSEGRGFGHVVETGDSYEVPHLGKFSWENSVAHPGAGARTVVVGLDDSGNGQVYVYVGTKTAAGLPVDRAGLTNGRLWGVRVAGLLSESDASVVADGTAFSLYSLGDVSAMTGVALEAASVGNVTGFQRPEDGAWDPMNPDDFYFVTTASFSGKSRLWRLRFDDAANPALGGTIDMLLAGDEGQKMMDNLCVTNDGSVLIQEDPGSQPYLARIWRYDIDSDTLTEVARHDPARFEPGAPPPATFLTQDEESSGILDAQDILGEGKFLIDVQVHRTLGGELVQDGQLLELTVPKGKKGN